MFTFPALLWFLPLAGVVVLIHLVTMFRYRPVPWAAMEFLLAGYKRTRTRILLRQLLLMLLRTLAVVVLILMLAGPKLAGPLAELFGGRPTHHIVLLDDSYSMSERNALQGGNTVFEEAVGTVRRIVQTGVKSGGSDRMTLLLASRSRKIALGEEPEFAERPMDARGAADMEARLQTLEVSESSAGPEAMLAAAKRILAESKTGNKPVVYLLSDYRAVNWEHPEPSLKTIDEIRKLGGMVRAIRTTDRQHPNVGLRAVRLVGGVHAADVEILLDATLVNYGGEDIEGIPLSISVDGRTQPNQTVPLLKAGEETPSPMRFPLRFQDGGVHRVRLQLGPDAVAADNQYSLALDVPNAVQVLLIAPEAAVAPRGAGEEGGETIPSSGFSRGAELIRTALAPGDVRSGIRVRIESPRFLSTDTLKPYQAVFLLDVPGLDKAAVRSLDDYLQAGGGVAFFLGPNTNARFVNEELYRDGDGFFPVRLLDVQTLAPDFLSREADITVADHPVFRMFGTGESPLLSAIRVDRYIASEPAIPEDRERRILAQLRGGSPFAAERTYGAGSCLVFTSTASPEWNAWSRNAGFVITMLDLVAYLSRNRTTGLSQPLESPITVQLDPSVYETTVRITPPASEAPGALPPEPATVDAILATDGSARLEYAATDGATDRAGFYEMELTRRDGGKENRVFAFHVDPDEGDTRLMDVGALADLLRKSETRIESTTSFSGTLEFTGARSLADFLLPILVLLLAAEMFLAGRLLPQRSAV